MGVDLYLFKGKDGGPINPDTEGYAEGYLRGRHIATAIFPETFVEEEFARYTADEMLKRINNAIKENQYIFDDHDIRMLDEWMLLAQAWEAEGYELLVYNSC